jgi:hypothetical protein
MLLRKFSKTIKSLVDEEKSYSPWPLKGQIDFNLAPVQLDLCSLKEINSMMLTIF